MFAQCLVSMLRSACQGHRVTDLGLGSYDHEDAQSVIITARPRPFEKAGELGEKLIINYPNNAQSIYTSIHGYKCAGLFYKEEM